MFLPRCLRNKMFGYCNGVPKYEREYTEAEFKASLNPQGVDVLKCTEIDYKVCPQYSKFATLTKPVEKPLVHSFMKGKEPLVDVTGKKQKKNKNGQIGMFQ